MSDTELKQAIDEILKLNPKPGGTVADFSLRTTGRKDYSGFYARFGRWRIAAEFKFRDIPGIENQ